MHVNFALLLLGSSHAIYGLAIYKDSLYWSDTSSGSVYYINKNEHNARNRQLLYNLNSRDVKDIEIVDRANHQGVYGAGADDRG